ncbi:unnamed protein product [Mytilus edulis]|uniref:Uncharacterized protein n=1 Tax=Mytilus edulis TaxID=6550 RepID=A0A8S3V1M7_MYTED|nr:unnamed protein product [Mytilus edulis]
MYFTSFALTGNKSCNYNESSVRRKIKDSVDQIKKMKKNKNKDVEGFLGKLPDRLPSKSLISSRLMVEAKIVACKQACEAMLTNYKPTEAKGNVLHQDATTKYHDHYEGMQVTLKDGSNLSLGLSKVGGGDAATYTKCFNNIIDDLARSYSNPDEDSTKVKAKLITSIKCFLSDQCATNNVFNENIEKLGKIFYPL